MHSYPVECRCTVILIVIHIQFIWMWNKICSVWRTKSVTQTRILFLRCDVYLIIQQCFVLWQFRRPFKCFLLILHFYKCLFHIICKTHYESFTTKQRVSPSNNTVLIYVKNIEYNVKVMCTYLRSNCTNKLMQNQSLFHCSAPRIKHSDKERLFSLEALVSTVHQVRLKIGQNFTYSKEVLINLLGFFCQCDTNLARSSQEFQCFHNLAVRPHLQFFCTRIWIHHIRSHVAVTEL